MPKEREDHGRWKIKVENKYKDQDVKGNLSIKRKVLLAKRLILLKRKSKEARKLLQTIKLVKQSLL